jgi:hypothetical protein
VHTPFEKEYLRADGTRVAVVVASAFLEDSRTRGISLVVDVSDRWRLEAIQAELLASAQAANRRLERVAAASDGVMRARTPTEVINRLVVSLCGPVGEFVSVFVPEGALLRRAATAHAHHPEAVEDFADRFPIPVSSDVPAAVAYRTGTAQPFPADPTALARKVTGADEFVAVMERLDIGTGVAVPMRARSETHGVLVVARNIHAEPFTPEDQAMLQTIADRAAAAYLNTTDLQTERAVATRLQEALLPTGMTVPDGYQIGAVYVPAGEGRSVGGDWWDLLTLPNRRLAVAVGDVTGHGVTTAAIMAELRNAIRGLLVHGASPCEALNSASELLQATRPDELATAFVAIADPTAGTLVYSSAGHPPALLRHDTGLVTLDAGRGTPLGYDAVPRTDACTTLPDPFELIAYTDGLVETPEHGIDHGINQLVILAEPLTPHHSAQERAERLVADLVGTSARDDVCLVILQRLKRPAIQNPPLHQWRTPNPP